MTLYSSPTSGQPVIPYVSNIGMWRDIVAMVDWWSKNKDNKPNYSGDKGIVPIAVNKSGVDFESGDLVTITEALDSTSSSPPISRQVNSPMLNIDVVTWANLSNVIVTHKTIKDGEVGPIATPNIFAVKGGLEKPTDTFVMVDPDDTKRVKSSDAGLFKILGALQDANDADIKYLVVDRRISQPIWRFSVFSPVRTDLLRLDGDLYKENINLIRPYGNKGEAGYCLQTGYGFVEINTIRQNFLGILTQGYYGVKPGFWVTPTVALEGALPSGYIWVQNIYKWDYGKIGAVVLVERDPQTARWIPLQQEYSCPEDGEEETPDNPEDPNYPSLVGSAIISDDTLVL